MDVRSLQRPLKEQYRREPSASRITLTARGAETATPMTCSVDIGRAIYQAEAHKGVGGTGTAACSGDLLLGALAACADHLPIGRGGYGSSNPAHRGYCYWRPRPAGYSGAFKGCPRRL